jgi:alpha-L-arabinofuranosidase
VDDHYYRSAAAMESDSTHYDHYSRTGPKIFVGEWASTEGSPTPTMNAALGDAAWLTGLERNSDLVKIASYAPLLVNVNPGGSQWGTNLIGYNALSSYGSPSYYAQAMFGKNRGDVVLPVEVTQREQAEAKSAPPHGAVGVGSWATQVEYRNIKVTSGGQTLYSTDFSKGDADWTVGDGAWQVSNGVLSQTGDLTNCRAVVGSPDWTDYTYTLQARKTGGAEGFLVLFHVVNSDNYIWWNIGGWGNTRTQLEVSRGGGKEGLGQPAANTVAVGRWYDIKIEVNGDDIKCYLDGRLVTETSAAAGKLVPLYTEASRDKATGDVILKVVNITAYPQTIQINLDGAVSVNPYGKSIALSGDPLAVNTIDNPTNVAPKTTKITNAGKSFPHTFPAHSVNVLRVNVK